jgi:3-deoxy-D-manno-octulosonic-acid transferase
MKKLEELKERVLTFYDFRSALVHGNRQRQKEIARKLNREGAVFLCNQIENAVQRALQVLLLNEKIRTKEGQNKFKQKPSKLIRKF